VQVGVAHTARGDTDENFAPARFGDRDFLDVKPAGGTFEDCCSHEIHWLDVDY
jgi:hypothetical protein